MYTKARAGELNRCRDARRATCGTIVRERLKREGSPPLRRRGANLASRAVTPTAVNNRRCSP